MAFEQRLPQVQGDDGSWGNILNQFIGLQHYDTGFNDPANGTHMNITIRPGTTAPKTAPLKFSSGSLMTAPESGSVEFLTDNLYFTQTTGITRKTIAAYDDSAGATGDLYYRDNNGYFKRLGIGTGSQVLTSVSGLPTWQSVSGSINNMDGGSASVIYGGAITINGGGA